MIVFAFFAFANGFTCNKKIQSSDVLKKDGFSNYLQHGVEILGLEGVKKLNKEMRQSFIIGLVIILIEFSILTLSINILLSFIKFLFIIFSLIFLSFDTT